MYHEKHPHALLAYYKALSGKHLKIYRSMDMYMQIIKEHSLCSINHTANCPLTLALTRKQCEYTATET